MPWQAQQWVENGLHMNFQFFFVGATRCWFQKYNVYIHTQYFCNSSYYCGWCGKSPRLPLSSYILLVVLLFKLPFLFFVELRKSPNGICERLFWRRMRDERVIGSISLTLLQQQQQQQLCCNSSKRAKMLTVANCSAGRVAATIIFFRHDNRRLSAEVSFKHHCNMILDSTA